MADDSYNSRERGGQPATPGPSGTSLVVINESDLGPLLHRSTNEFESQFWGHFERDRLRSPKTPITYRPQSLPRWCVSVPDTVACRPSCKVLAVRVNSRYRPDPTSC